MIKHIQKTIISYLKEYITTQTSIVVGVSGWPDSMLLAYFVQQYYTDNGRDQSLINIAHFNHWQRKESIKEHIFLQKHFEYNTFYWNVDIPSTGLWETKLRDKRHTFFQEVLDDTQSTCLLLWHNLSDRIETSLMNIVRGASLKGVLWIKSYEKKKNYTILRPLITVEKYKIQEVCDTLNIPYFVDATNTQDITQRNILRNTLIPQIQNLHTGWQKNWYSSWQELYQSVDTLQHTDTHTIKPLPQSPHHHRWVTKRYTLPIYGVTKNTIHSFFATDTYMTKKRVNTVYEFIHGSATWQFFVWWWYIFKTWHTIHLLFWPKEFWKKPLLVAKKITHSWLLQFDGNIYSIDQSWIWAQIRYPQPWDIYKQKKLAKILLNKKIPVFMRHTIPVVASWYTILAILD